MHSYLTFFFVGINILLQVFIISNLLLRYNIFFFRLTRHVQIEIVETTLTIKRAWAIDEEPIIRPSYSKRVHLYSDPETKNPISYQFTCVLTFHGASLVMFPSFSPLSFVTRNSSSPRRHRESSPSKILVLYWLSSSLSRLLSSHHYQTNYFIAGLNISLQI